MFRLAQTRFVFATRPNSEVLNLIHARIITINANYLSFFKFKETPRFYFSLLSVDNPKDTFEQHTKKGVFCTVRTEAYRRYLPPVFPVPDTSVTSIQHQYRYWTLG